MRPIRITPIGGEGATAPGISGSASARLADALREPLTRALEGTGPAVEAIDGATASSPDIYDALPEDAALIVHTSGSTGTPKRVVLSRGALIASATATADRLDGPGQWLLALSPQHIAGLQVLIRSLLAGTVPVTLDTSAPFTSESFAEAVSQMPAGTAPRYTSLVPTQIRRLLDSRDPDALRAAGSFQAILAGGAALPDSLARQAYEAGLNLVTTYGMSETCGGCVYDGMALSSARIRTDDDGRVQIGGDVLASGYLGEDGLDQQGFSVDDDGARWFTTSDLGQVWDGQLEIFGRADDVIISGGRNVAPQAVEAVLVSLPGIAEALVVGVEDREWGQRVVGLLVADPTEDLPALEDLRSAVKERLGAPAAPAEVFVVDDLPTRSLGKPDRRAAARLAAELTGEQSRYGRGPDL